MRSLPLLLVLSFTLASCGEKRTGPVALTTQANVPSKRTVYPLDLGGMLMTLSEEGFSDFQTYLEKISEAPAKPRFRTQPPHQPTYTFDLSSMLPYEHDWRNHLVFARWLEKDADGAWKWLLAKGRSAPSFFETWIVHDTAAAIHAVQSLEKTHSMLETALPAIIQHLAKSDPKQLVRFLRESDDLLTSDFHTYHLAIHPRDTELVTRAIASQDLELAKSFASQPQAIATPLASILKEWMKTPDQENAILQWLWDLQRWPTGLDDLAACEGVSFEMVAEALLGLPLVDRRIDWIASWLTLWHEQNATAAEAWIEENLYGHVKVLALGRILTSHEKNLDAVFEGLTELAAPSGLDIPSASHQGHVPSPTHGVDVFPVIKARWPNNFQEGLSAIAGIPDPSTQRQALRQWIDYGMNQSPQMVWDWLATFPGSLSSREVQRWREDALTRLHLRGAVLPLDKSIPDLPPEARDLLLERMAQNAPENLLQWLKNHPGHANKDTLYSNALERLSHRHPDQAAEWLPAIKDSEQRGTLVSWISRGWARKDLEAALAWFDSLPEEEATGLVLKGMIGSHLRDAEKPNFSLVTSCLERKALNLNERKQLENLSEKARANFESPPQRHPSSDTQAVAPPLEEVAVQPDPLPVPTEPLANPVLEAYRQTALREFDRNDDFSAHLEEALSLPYTALRNFTLRRVIEAWTREHPRKAFATCLKWARQPLSRLGWLPDACAAEWLRTDPIATFDAVYPKVSLGWDFALELCQAYASIDFEALIQRLENKERRGRYGYTIRGAALSILAESDHHRALSLAAKYQVPLMIPLAQWVVREPEEAIAWTTEHHFKSLPPLLNAWYLADPDAVLHYLENIVANGSSIYQIALSVVITGLSGGVRPPEECANWLESLPNVRSRSRLMAHGAGTLAQHDPERAIRWFESLHEQDQNQALFRGMPSVMPDYKMGIGLVDAYATKDLDAASAWVATLEKPFYRHHAQGILVRRWLTVDPKRAIALLNQLLGEGAQEQVAQCLSRWAWHDLAEARRWFEGLTKDQRERLESTALHSGIITVEKDEISSRAKPDAIDLLIQSDPIRALPEILALTGREEWRASLLRKAFRLMAMNDERRAQALVLTFKNHDDRDLAKTVLSYMLPYNEAWKTANQIRHQEYRDEALSIVIWRQFAAAPDLSRQRLTTIRDAAKRQSLRNALDEHAMILRAMKP